jgi:cytochrome c oxidase assembly factor CtaG
VLGLLAHGGAPADGALWVWRLDPLQIVPIALLALLYGRRVWTLERRGTPVEGWRIACFALGLLLALAVLVSPVDHIGETRLFMFHMLQHVVLGDLAPFFVVLGLTGPILRPVLALRWVERLRVLAHPLVALPLWALNLYLWHVPFLYEAAIRHDALHALEHVSFAAGGFLIWASVLELLPGPEWFGTGWKLGYVAIVRLVETPLANVFFWGGSVFYGIYDHDTDRLWGIEPLQDQGWAGAVMMTEGGILTLCVLAWLFLRLAEEGELRQQLLERGLEPRAVRRAVRYGRGHELGDVRRAATPPAA